MSSTLVWVIFLLIVIFTFKTHIDSILNTFSKKGKVQYGNFNIELGTEAPALLNDQQGSKHLELQKTYQSHVITTEELVIKNQLKEAKLTAEQTINVLIYQLANANLNTKLLAIDKLIFPEQVELLLFLNSRVKPTPETELLHFYTKWKNKNLSADYPFRGFLNFLLSQRLIFESIDGINIAAIGKEYLGFLIKIGRSLPSIETSQENHEIKNKNK